MPNVKIHVDETLFAERRVALRDLMQPLQDSLCAELNVKPAAVTIAVIPVMGHPAQLPAGMEIAYIARPDRTVERITAACTVFRAMVADALGTGLTVRATVLDPQTYVVLK